MFEKTDVDLFHHAKEKWKLSKINPWFIKTHSWKKNKDMKQMKFHEFL